MNTDPPIDGTPVLRIALFEFLCSSGAYCDSGPQGPYAPLLDEGAAMLLSCTSDLARSNHSVEIALESSILQAWKSRQPHALILDQVDVHSIKTHSIDACQEPDAQTIANRWSQIALSCDRAIVIAPELDGLLEGIIREMRLRGCQVIAPDDRFIRTASDKWETYLHWAASEQLTAPTALASDWLKDTQSLRFDQDRSDGWVLKRRRTAGGTDMQRFPTKDALAKKLDQMLQVGQRLDQWIVQPWILGTPASLVVLGPTHLPDTKPKVIGPSEQLFDPITGSYIGGQGPLDCDPDRLSRFAQNLLEAIPGDSAGWVGIDFLILPDQQWIPLEINARLTSSYLGYRMLYGPQLACAIFGDPLRDVRSQAGSKPNAFRFSVSDFHG